MIDYVESGVYKRGRIKLKGLMCKPVIVHKTLFGRTDIRLNKSNVKSYEVISTQTVVGTSTFRSRIVFKDGRECHVYVSCIVHDAIMKALA